MRQIDHEPDPYSPRVLSTRTAMLQLMVKEKDRQIRIRNDHIVRQLFIICILMSICVMLIGIVLFT